MNRVLLVWAALVIMGAASPAAAHPVPFSYLDARLEPSAVDVTLVAHVFDVAHDLGVDRPESLLDPAVLKAKREAIAMMLASRVDVAADGERLAAARWDAPESLP